MAVLLSAATGGVGLDLHHDGGSGGHGDTYGIEPGPVPQGDGQVDTQELDADPPEASGDQEITALVNGCLDGVTSDCEKRRTDLVAVDLLRRLLEQLRPPVPDLRVAHPRYQDYGATCGGRFDDWTYAGNCGGAPL